MCAEGEHFKHMTEINLCRLNQNFFLWTLLSTGFFTKLFKTNNIDVVKSCQSYFRFSLPSEEWAKRANNLDAKYIACERAFVHYGSTMPPRRTKCPSNDEAARHFIQFHLAR